jgi:hypothetical protein
MRPPAFAQALVAAAAPSGDYEIIAGDLHEEYLRVLRLSNARTANRWYWAQTLLSIPSLLSYSRLNKSPVQQIGVAFIALAALIAMAGVFMMIDTVVKMPLAAEVCIAYADAAFFGAALARLVRTDGLRVAVFASLFLVLCFIVPALAGHPGSQAPLIAWIVLCGVIPAMCLGAGLYQAMRRKVISEN